MFEKFIKATDEYTTKENWVRAPYIRKTFELDFTPEKCELCICTPGFYVLYINGCDITKGFLAPYISNPDDFVCYDKYDILPYLKKGKNAIAFMLGNGFANQSIDQWNYDTATFRAPLCASVFLRAEANGNVLSFSSDESFKKHPSPIIYDMYRHGTHYDARLEIAGWNMPDFDDSQWDNVSISKPPRGEIVHCSAHPITAQYELRAKSVEYKKDFYYMKTAYDTNPFTGEAGVSAKETYVKEGHLYDFGLNRSGVCRLKIQGQKGQRIVVRHCEKLDHDGNFNINSMYTVHNNYAEYVDLLYTDVYILKGGEEEIFIPPFVYHGFRYALVEGITAKQATDDLLTYIVFNSDVERRCFFECSDEMMQKLYEMAIASDVSNFHYFPTDCPHREKNGWTGDINASAEQYSLHFDWAESMRLWLKSVRFAQKDGVIPGTVPTVGKFYDACNGPAWDAVCVSVPYYIYKYDGRTDVLKENASLIMNYLEYVITKRDKNGLYAFGLGDWCQNDSCGSHGIAAPLRLTDTAMVYDIAAKASFIFDVLGMSEQKEYAMSLCAQTKAAIRENLIDFTSMTADGNCQTSQALLLSLGMFNDDEYNQAYERLIELIHEKDDHLHCGVIGLRHIFEQLALGGDIDLALKLILREDAPSYAYIAKQGATALCEILKENGFNESGNHHFLGDFIRIFVSYIAGLRINPYVRDINEIVISPVIPSKLERASARYSTKCGEISVEWKKKGDSVHLEAFVPDGIKAEFVYKNQKQSLTAGKTKLNFMV